MRQKRKRSRRKSESLSELVPLPPSNPRLTTLERVVAASRGSLSVVKSAFSKKPLKRGDLPRLYFWSTRDDPARLKMSMCS